MKTPMRAGALLATLLATLLSVTAHAAVDPNKAIDFRADRLRVQGGKADMALVGAEYVQKITVAEGQTLGFVCDWSANLVSGVGYWKTNSAQQLQVVFRRDGNTFAFASATVPAGTQLGSKTTNTSGWKTPSFSNPSPYQSSSTSTNSAHAFKGSVGIMKWTAAKPGTHEFTCVIPKTGFEEPTLGNNIATAVVEVLPKPHKQLSAAVGGNPAADTAVPKATSGGTLMPAPGAVVTGGAMAPAPGLSRRATLPAPWLPDLASGAQVVVAGKFAAAPGATLALQDTDARAAAAGVCQVAFEHEMRNLGQADSPAADRQWTIEGNPAAVVAQTPPIAAGAALSRVDTLGLRPGPNKLRLRLDVNQQVQEASESNNELTLTVNLAGSCGGASTAMPQTAPTDNLRFSPAKESGAPVRR
jgi:hypothetical protein